MVAEEGEEEKCRRRAEIGIGGVCCLSFAIDGSDGLFLELRGALKLAKTSSRWKGGKLGRIDKWN